MDARVFLASLLLGWVACGWAQAEESPLRSKVLEVHVPVRDHADDLPGAIQAQLSQMTQDGYRVVDQYYRFSWTPIVRGKSYRARFEKLMDTPDGAPVLNMLARGTDTEASLAFILLQFGQAQHLVKEALVGLKVGQFVELNVDF